MSYNIKDINTFIIKDYPRNVQSTIPRSTVEDPNFIIGEWYDFRLATYTLEELEEKKNLLLVMLRLFPRKVIPRRKLLKSMQYKWIGINIQQYNEMQPELKRSSSRATKTINYHGQN